MLKRGMASGRFKTIDVELMVSFVVGATISVMRGILDGRLKPGADVNAAVILLRSCGLPDDQATAIASQPLEP